jgi:hypothetical protein
MAYMEVEVIEEQATTPLLYMKAQILEEIPLNQTL